jgi:hypothetical protein
MEIPNLVAMFNARWANALGMPTVKSARANTQKCSSLWFCEKLICGQRICHWMCLLLTATSDAKAQDAALIKCRVHGADFLYFYFLVSLCMFAIVRASWPSLGGGSCVCVCATIFLFI